MKIALGTAQFGLDYGLSNKSGMIPDMELNKIFSLAKKFNVKTIDTAVGYGQSEARLGDYGISDFDVITKLSVLPKNIEPSLLECFIKKEIENSLKRLKTKSLYGLLVHDASDLMGSCGNLLYKSLLDAKKVGLVRKIGISIYDPSELDNIFSKFDFDIVQSPLNLFDQRLISSGWLERLKTMKKEVHARSIFLQGLLLMKPKSRPAYFDKWEELFCRYDSWLSDMKISNIEASLAFAINTEDLDKIIIGIDSSLQFQEIISLANEEFNFTFNNFSSQDEYLINPFNWKL